MVCRHKRVGKLVAGETKSVDGAVPSFVGNGRAGLHAALFCRSFSHIHQPFVLTVAAQLMLPVKDEETNSTGAQGAG